MPRHADHEQRRAELAEAVSRIILDHGIDRVSVRSVAQESGWSVGAVRYYFPRQEDLLSHALRQMITRAVARIERIDQGQIDDPVEWANTILCTTAPIAEDTKRDIRIWLAFVDRGLSRDHIAELMDEIWQGGRYFSRRMVAAMADISMPSEMGVPLDDPFLEETATVLHVMWNGIAFQGIMAADRLGPDEICRLTRRVLNTISQRLRVHQSHPQLIN
jgi:AcrR family transcriptional regulator